MDRTGLSATEGDAVPLLECGVSVGRTGSNDVTLRNDDTGSTACVVVTSPAQPDLTVSPAPASSAMEQPPTMSYRTAEQLAAMAPIKRARRSIVTEETGEVDCVVNRRAVDTRIEYRVTWVDGSDPIWLPRDRLIEDGNANLIETLDAYLLRYPNRELTYQAHICRNARAFSAVADRTDNSCLPNAV
ncbi:hypothetical protein CCR75_004892 [Bremia lactucae]|uniref:Chromo domain-containing protein n=1 Tax=Bremia lactucae TaxID=4779 RepID=A0A976IBI9_BRELC|nr:hypothetical protein CCR75_004892 [Bremia lactucae]